MILTLKTYIHVTLICTNKPPFSIFYTFFLGFQRKVASLLPALRELMHFLLVFFLRAIVLFFNV